jgi:hypothetical protein
VYSKHDFLIPKALNHCFNLKKRKNFHILFERRLKKENKVFFKLITLLMIVLIENDYAAGEEIRKKQPV